MARLALLAVGLALAVWQAEAGHLTAVPRPSLARSLLQSMYLDPDTVHTNAQMEGYVGSAVTNDQLGGTYQQAGPGYKDIDKTQYADDMTGSFWQNTPGYYTPIWQGTGLTPEAEQVDTDVADDFGPSRR
ncbi:hypothetical protein Rsub_02391 [Raphidocelis subcapitata]|uniref:Uncharacterized protein n=1 Tax=Raphidocelis subcapitata TaxID=307507 RepID=A0A2V0NZP8_9CHLO|nr:hypothetical protein Rsub_02391 [Raphidocelis subcapitata]|eukprot:GBF90285.1 hypothetical protein Rsub_02391 [Raphidocelis subcapitata]